MKCRHDVLGLPKAKKGFKLRLTTTLANMKKGIMIIHNNFKTLLTASALSFVATAACLSAESTDSGGAKPRWKIQGDLEEACTCNAACPCWFNSKPSRMNCGGGQVLFIEKGKYGKVSLDGLALASFGQSPDGQTMMDSFGNWNFSTLYIDDKANPEQREALKEIGMKVLPVGASKNVETRYIPLTRQIEGAEHKISMGQYGSFEGHLLEGGLGGRPQIVNPPGADPLHASYLQGRTTKLEFTDAGQNWKLENSNYMLGKFKVDSRQYEKFSAGLAKKMAEMKQENPQQK